jgi:hypothetical protein
MGNQVHDVLSEEFRLAVARVEALRREADELDELITLLRAYVSSPARHAAGLARPAPG